PGRLPAEAGPATIGNAFRYSADRFLLLPAARSLPRWAAIAVAWCFGAVEAASSGYGRGLGYEHRVAVGMPRARAWRPPLHRASQVRRDIVELQRLALGRSHRKLPRVTLVGQREGLALLAADLPFILTTGHFRHWSLVATRLALPRHRPLIIVTSAARQS